MTGFEWLINNALTLIETDFQAVRNASLKNKMCNNLQVYGPLCRISPLFEVSFL